MPKLHLPDINLYYERAGEEGQAVLFIHGLGSSTRDWEYQVPYFAPRYQVITFDVRGHGKSDKPAGPYSIPLFTDDTIALIKALKIAPVHVVGLSMGGMIAFQLAVSAPELLKSMVIVNSGPELIVRTLKERLLVWQRLLIVKLLGMRKMGQVLSKRLLIKPEQEALRQIFVQRWAENDKRAYLDAFRGFLGWSVSEHLGSIETPTLVIAADEDYTPISLKEAYVAKMPHAELTVFPDSRHLTPIEHPQAFNERLDAFWAT